jgi:hypothetical protein
LLFTDFWKKQRDDFAEWRRWLHWWRRIQRGGWSEGWILQAAKDNPGLNEAVKQSYLSAELAAHGNMD